MLRLKKLPINSVSFLYAPFLSARNSYQARTDGASLTILVPSLLRNKGDVCVGALAKPGNENAVAVLFKFVFISSGVGDYEFRTSIPSLINSLIIGLLSAFSPNL